MGKIRTRGRKTTGPAAAGRRASGGEADTAGAVRSGARGTAAAVAARRSSPGRTATARGSARPAAGTGTHRRRGTAAGTRAGTAGAARCRRSSPSPARPATASLVPSRQPELCFDSLTGFEMAVVRRWKNRKLKLESESGGRSGGSEHGGWGRFGGRSMDRDPARGQPCGFLDVDRLVSEHPPPIRNVDVWDNTEIVTVSRTCSF
jgi:hypothetical protein